MRPALVCPQVVLAGAGKEAVVAARRLGRKFLQDRFTFRTGRLQVLRGLRHRLFAEHVGVHESPGKLLFNLELAVGPLPVPAEDIDGSAFLDLDVAHTDFDRIISRGTLIDRRAQHHVKPQLAHRIRNAEDRALVLGRFWDGYPANAEFVRRVSISDHQAVIERPVEAGVVADTDRRVAVPVIRIARALVHDHPLTECEYGIILHIEFRSQSHASAAQQ